ncbi:MAG: hypothetical protein ACR2LP_01865 [Candidatus Limnocylindrales bacterium]
MRGSDEAVLGDVAIDGRLGHRVHQRAPGGPARTNWQRADELAGGPAATSLTAATPAGGIGY